MQTDYPTCTLCSRQIDLIDDCWRRSRQSTTDSAHVLCIAVAVVIDESPSRLTGEIVDDVNSASDALCLQYCDNPGHRVNLLNSCQRDGWMIRPDYVIGCSTDDSEADWAFNHFHAVLTDGTGCMCRHESHQDARIAHGLVVE